MSETATTLSLCLNCKSEPANKRCSCPCHLPARTHYQCGCISATGVPVKFCARAAQLDTEWLLEWNTFQTSQDKADLRRYQDTVKRYYAHFED